MKRIFILTAILVYNFFKAYPQANCSNPLQVNICPAVYLPNQTNAGMLDDAGAFNSLGEDLVYQINVNNGADKIHVSVTNASAGMWLSLQEGTCGVSSNVSMHLSAGNSNTTFSVSTGGPYYLWVDASTTVTYNISIGADTSATFINIPDTQGNLHFDQCSSHPFAPTKRYFDVAYNGIYQTNPMMLPGLFAPGQICTKFFFANTTGVEGIKEVQIFLDPVGFVNVSAPASIPGFYNAGNWIGSFNGLQWIYTFHDLAGTGRGDFTGSPNACLSYEFCFNVTPTSNSPQLTNIAFQINTDGYGLGFTGWNYGGCCPAPFANCHGGSPGGNGVNSFAFSFADPGNPLPVELLDFKAQQENGNVILRWSTATETNNDYFLVERSQNASEWNYVDQVAGAGNSTQTLYYSTTDHPEKSGRYYYRLTQFDFDGQSSKSKIITVDVKRNREIAIHSNPSSQFFEIEGDEIDKMNFSLFDVTGKTMKAEVAIHGNVVTIDVSKLSSGIFILIVEMDGERVGVKKIIVE